ncbi:PREDICTED: probable G-protein coupled receptor No18 [Branchiostoma belcheri]|uniref:Histamine H1 receptor n=1 Tax=Branchiostoma belcheri TaxID=7741 RepID=A0A6P5AHN5_BRABE|nr:PREDICTED: probable G-protein coupled receptor No18 [Branchiostoma belcheri]
MSWWNTSTVADFATDFLPTGAYNVSLRNVTGTGQVDGGSLWTDVALGIVLGSLCLLTSVGNAMVLHAVRTNRDLQTVSNFFIVSLAVSDLAVGTVVMPLSTVNIVAHQWVLGLPVCQVWLSVDYVASTASIFNLFVLNLDRYWSVTTPLKYMRKRTKRRAMAFIALVWGVSSLWIIPIVGWHVFEFGGVRKVPGDVCDTEFSSNCTFKVLTSLFNFYFPMILMSVIYAQIYNKVRLFNLSVHISRGSVPTENDIKMHEGLRRSSTSELQRLRARRGSLSVAGDKIRGTSPEKKSSPAKSCNGPRGSQQPVSVLAKMTSQNNTAVHSVIDTVPDDVKYLSVDNKESCSRRSSGDMPPIPEDESDLKSERKSSKMSWPGGRLSPRRSIGDPQGSPSKQASAKKRLSLTRGSLLRRMNLKNRSRMHSERKAAKQLGILMGCFVACWLPYSILFVAFCNSTDIGENILIGATWLGYINSTMNPFLYPLCNDNFKRAFRKMLGCGEGSQLQTTTTSRL